MQKEPSKGFVPYLDIEAIETGIAHNFAEVVSSRMASEKDVLVVWDGARSGWTGLGRHGAICSTIMALETKGCDRDYLQRFIQSQFHHINTNTRGTGIPHVDPEVFWNLEVPLPPLSEQRRIVQKLDRLLAKVDACQQRLEKIPILLKRFRQSVLAAACSGRLTEDWRKKHEIEPAASLLKQIKEWRLAVATGKKDKDQLLQWFGRDNYSIGDDEIIFDSLPETWEMCRIGAIGKVCNGSTPSRKRPDYWGTDIAWVSSGEVQNNIVRETREKITRAGYDSCSVQILPTGTVLLAMIGEGRTRGQTAILNINATINQNIAAIIIEHGYINSKYLWWWFQMRYQMTRKQGSGSGPQALNCQRVRELPFLLPPIPEQQEIVRRVEALFKIADRIEERYQRAKIQVDKLTQSILAKAFRGELVPQDFSDEPASILLERIKQQKISGNQSKNYRAKGSRRSPIPPGEVKFFQ